MLKKIGSWVLDILVILIVVYLITTFVGQRTSVIGDSMRPTLQNGNQVIIDKISYRITDPQRFDIIVFPYRMNPNQLYIKRIIGMPGDTIYIEDGLIYINDEPLEEDFGLEEIINPGVASEPITIGQEEYFVIGDNRNNSSDSRFMDVGHISKEDIIGRAWLTIWPLEDFGFLRDNN
ncbi:signal peptidase I [Natranaerovirga hydrolytica]|uniref:Signal peptidase I n=1 Tax=Natranaerovirga hydrolytica TaxID=680378 RepID=A0A4R1N0C2_9FIRM|nr:signal peptidase I [Natranaerovirga hydrolytica]TCK98302.1 signal peptidase I [Natranaerovirga hydrolytica]